MKLLQAEALGLTLDRFRERLGLAEAPQMQVEEFGTYAKFLESGVAVLLTDERISSIYLYADGVDGYTGYSGDLGDLRIDTSKQIVRFLFGVPSVKREMADIELLGTALAWDRYDYDDYSYHFQYDDSGKRLQMLTILSAETLRRLAE